MRILPLAVLAASIVAAAAFAACGDDDSAPGPAETPTVAAAGTAPPQARPTSFPTPLVEGDAIRSLGKGYVAQIPEGWSFRANLIQSADASADAMYAPLETGANAQASIAINCIHLRPGEPEDRIAFQATNTARIGLHQNIVQSNEQFAGYDALVLTYTFQSQENPDQRLDKRDIIFTGENCDWVITFSAPGDEYERYEPAFDTFADAFEEIEPEA